MSNERIKADIKSLGIVNLILLIVDNKLLSKNSPSYKFTKSASRFPDVLINHLRFNFEGLELLEDHFALKIREPYSFELLDFELNDKLSKLNIGEINLPLKDAALNGEEVNLIIDEGTMNIKDQYVGLINEGYSIKKNDEGSAFLSLNGGEVNSALDIISKGKFRNLELKLDNYDYKTIKGNSIVNNSISVNGNFGPLQNNYEFRTSNYYYVLKRFDIKDFVVSYSDNGVGNVSRNFSLNNKIDLDFRDLYF